MNESGMRKENEVRKRKVDSVCRVFYGMFNSCLCWWRSGRTVRFADIPQSAKKRKKRVVKKTKAITPLQAMMLRMAGNHTHTTFILLY